MDEISLAEDLLGRDDVLVRALKRESIAVAQLAAAVIALAVSVVGVAPLAVARFPW